MTLYRQLHTVYGLTHAQCLVIVFDLLYIALRLTRRDSKQLARCIAHRQA
jgi:hypothetical protein